MGFILERIRNATLLAHTVRENVPLDVGMGMVAVEDKGTYLPGHPGQHLQTKEEVRAPDSCLLTDTCRATSPTYLSVGKTSLPREPH